MSILGSKNGFSEDAGCAGVVLSATTRPLALVEEAVGAVGT